MNLKLKITFSVVLIINIFLIIYYQAFIYKAFFNSDAAIANILAQEIFDKGSYYPKSWWYVNGDIWTLFKHTLVIPFSLLGFEAYNVHTLTVLSFFSFSLFITYLYLKKIGVDTAGTLIALIGVSTLYSPMYAREVFGESAYIWYYTALISYLYLFFIISKEEIKTKRKWIVKFLLVLLTIFFVAENPSRFAIYFIAALFLPLFIFYKYINIKYKKIILYFSIGIILGIIYRYTVIGNILMHSGAEKAYLISFEDLPTHIWRSIVGVINFYGADWGEKTPFVSFNGIAYILKLLLYPIAFFAPIYYAIKNRIALREFEIYTITVGYTAFFVVFGIYAITSLHNGNIYAAKENIRYIIPFALVISVANGIMWNFFSQKIKLLLIFSIFTAYLSMPNTLQFSLSQEIIKDREEAIESLIENGLNRGYAPYWHSHIFTVLSDGKVEVRPLENAKLRKAGRWLTSTSWYDKNYVDKNSFILIPNEKIQEFESSQKELNLTEATKKIELRRYNIYIFEQNPLNNN